MSVCLRLPSHGVEGGTDAGFNHDTLRIVPAATVRHARSALGVATGARPNRTHPATLSLRLPAPKRTARRRASPYQGVAAPAVAVA